MVETTQAVKSFIQREIYWLSHYITSVFDSFSFTKKKYELLVLSQNTWNISKNFTWNPVRSTMSKLS